MVVQNVELPQRLEDAKDLPLGLSVSMQASRQGGFEISILFSEAFLASLFFVLEAFTLDQD